MKRFLSLATLSMALGTASTLAQSEVEALRARCAEQERQIRQLEEENSKLRGESPSTTPPTSVPKPSSAATPPPVQAAADGTIYIVQAGDSMPKISRKTGAPVNALLKINKLKSGGLIYPGQKLQIPSDISPPSKETLTPVEAPALPSGKSHEVKLGETFFSIAKKYSVSTADLIAANPNTKPSALRPGQRLNLEIAPPLTPTPPPSEIPTPTPTPTPTPPPAESIPSAPSEVAPNAQAAPRSEKPVAVLIEAEMTYSEFAAKYQTDTNRLNALNGLELIPSTVLAKGSELYVPAASEPVAP